MTDAVDGIVLAAGRGDRLGLGPKAWLTLGGKTLIERAVATLALVTTRITVGVAPGDIGRAEALFGCGVGPRGGDAVADGIAVVAGGASHRETMAAAVRAGPAPIILVHDVAHPFVTPALAREVIEAARARGAAVAAVRSTSSAYHEPRGAPRARLAPGDVWLIRRPFACRRADLERVLDAVIGEDGLSTILAAAGVHTEVVPAPPWNIKITVPEDWALAQAIEHGLHPV